jgi:plastocyanin
MRRLRQVCLALASAAAFGCGGSSGPSSPSPSPAPSPSPSPGPSGGTTITITASGVSPGDITVPVGSRVTFVNNDSRPHEMNSDPHPTHGDCPEIDAVSFIAAGQSRATNNLNTARTCRYHDHQQPTNTSLQGIIRVQ